MLIECLLLISSRHSVPGGTKIDAACARCTESAENWNYVRISEISVQYCTIRYRYRYRISDSLN